MKTIKKLCNRYRTVEESRCIALQKKKYIYIIALYLYYSGNAGNIQ